MTATTPLLWMVVKNVREDTFHLERGEETLHGYWPPGTASTLRDTLNRGILLELALGYVNVSPFRLPGESYDRVEHSLGAMPKEVRGHRADDACLLCLAKLGHSAPPEAAPEWTTRVCPECGTVSWVQGVTIESGLAGKLCRYPTEHDGDCAVCGYCALVALKEALQPSAVQGEERTAADNSQPYGELWIDTAGEAHFQCHTQGHDFPQAKAAIEKFIAVLQRQVQDETSCPYGPSSSPTATAHLAPLRAMSDQEVDAFNEGTGLLARADAPPAQTEPGGETSMSDETWDIHRFATEYHAKAAALDEAVKALEQIATRRAADGHWIPGYLEMTQIARATLTRLAAAESAVSHG